MSCQYGWTDQDCDLRLQRALDQITNDPAAQAVFTKALPDRALKQAGSAKDHSTPLAGALISVKALFDLQGETTTAAAKVLKDATPAAKDATAIARLDEAGGVFVGITNMSEFAYSGLGLNPHFGTPDNPLYPGCAPGGSTSGGAVSVALGLADIAIGSDTGGSLRIPAAFCGITGFKPTQATVSRDGGKPLSESLDSFGPMAKSVAECELAWQVMAGEVAQPVSAKGARLVIPTNFGFSEMEPSVKTGFEAVIAQLKSAGFEILEKELGCIELYEQVPPWHMTSVESRAHYETFFQSRANDMDRRVHARMAKADEISAIDYRQTLIRREQLISAFRQELGDDLLVLPTTPLLPPKLEELADDEMFNKKNMLALRNPSLANITDSCSIALPYKDSGLTLSLMLVAAGGRDKDLLAVAKGVEVELQKTV